MSKYTFELREVISTFGEDEVKGWLTDFELSDYLTPEEIRVIEEKGVWSKEKLAKRIIDHYYTREIGTDAIGQFILFARDRIREIMETYAPVIYSASIKFDPLYNVNVTETFSATRGNVTTSTSSSSDSGLTVSSDTPQGEINKSEILSGKYASSTSATEGDRETSDNSTSDGTEDYVRTNKGASGVSQMMLLQQYRDIIRAINTEIVYGLEPLFMGLY